jgi:serine/threonine protein kinase
VDYNDALPLSLAPPMSLQLNTQAASRAWDDLADRLERFIASWEAGDEPALAEFLPDEPLNHRRIVLVELVKVDLEQRIMRGSIAVTAAPSSSAAPSARGGSQPQSTGVSKRLDQYLAEYPELIEPATGEPSCDLIYEEFHIRRQAGLEASLSDYCRRYPKSAEALKRLLGTEGASVSSQILSPTKRVGGVAPGQRLDDFDLLVQLGKGAFGSVFLARQVSMQRLVAVKISDDKGNEPRTLATFDHPNIIRVFDQKRLTEKGMLLCYMVYAPGGTLADVVRRVRETPPATRSGALLIESVNEAMQKAGQFPPEDSPWRRRLAVAAWSEIVCRLGVPLAQALDHAHKNGTLHRDVKPANVLLSAEGSPKLADFNISFNSQIEGATPAAFFGGSLAYMSPEQLEACNPAHARTPDELDGRTDVYSLAVVLWELLHGERPFPDDDMSGGWQTTLENMTKVRRTEEPFRPPGPRDPVTTRLEHVLKKSLAPDAANRQPDGASLAHNLSLCLNPRAWDLVHELQSGWRRFAVHHPLWSLVAINMPAFLLAGAFNAWYNWVTFMAWQPPTTKAVFGWIALFVNTLLYPLGIALVFAYIWSMARTVRRVAEGESLPHEQLVDARRRSMLAGRVIAVVGLVLWVLAGLIFPTVLSLTVDGFPVLEGYLRFVPAMVLCGLISCCFPFLATTWMCIRVFFPSLLGSGQPEPQEQKQLIALSQRANIYYVMSVVVPFLALGLAVLTGDKGREATIALSIASVAGFIAAYFTYNRIRSDLAALSIATRPADMVGTMTDSVEVF